jgi:hypothetical protein
MASWKEVIPTTLGCISACLQHRQVQPSNHLLSCAHTVSEIEYKTADAQSLCATAAVVLLRSQDQTLGS